LTLSLALSALSLQPRLHCATRRTSALSSFWHGQRPPEEKAQPRLRVLAILPLAARIARDHAYRAFIAHPGA
jgi:hypothetical protein